MDPTYEALERLRQRIDNASDDAERASLLGEVVAVLDAPTPTLPPEAHHLFLAQARRELGETLGSLGRHAEAETQLALALSALDQVVSAPTVREIERARCHYALGDTYRATRRTAEALDAYGAAVARFERLVHHDHGGGLQQALALSREALATAAFELAAQGQALRLVRPVEAASAFTRAIAAFESLPAEVRDDKLEEALAGCYNELGSALAIAGRFEDAVRAYQRCLSGFEKLAARDPARFEPVLVMALSGLGATFRELARWNESIDVSKRAVDLYERLRLASTSSFFDLKLGTELAHIREASVVPQAIDAADVHFVLSPTALSRAWCCYELALFHRRAIAEEGSSTLRSFVAPIGTVPYRGFSYAKTTSPGDKPVLEEWLRAHYPGGVDGVDALLMMSSLLSDSFVVSGDAWPKAAEATVTESVDKWLAR